MNITFTNKQVGDRVSPADMNEIKNAVNSKADSTALEVYLTKTSASGLYQPKGAYLTGVSWSEITSKPSLFSGSYADLINKPTGLATETYVNAQGFIKAIPTIAYSSLSGLPTLFSGNYNDLTNKPATTGNVDLTPYLTKELATATYQLKGAYLTAVTWNDITGKPTGLATETYVNAQGFLKAIPTISYTSLSNLPTLFSGNYNDLTNKPSITGGASINDSVASGTTTYSSTKIESSLSGKASKVSGKVPLSELPDINLLQYFDLTQFAVKDGLISYIGVANSPALPTASAPTNGIVSDSNNTFAFTLNPNYPNLSSYEFVVGSGNFNTVTVMPIPVGDILIPVGDLRVRVKAVAGVSNASDWLTNTVAFTPTVALSTPSAPSNAVVNDTANSFGFTLNPNYPSLSSYEYQIGTGTIIPVSANPILVGDVAIPVSGIRVRVKAVANVSNVSAWLTNTVAFTATVVAVPDTLTPLTAWWLDPGLTLKGTNGNTLAFDASVAGGYGQTWAQFDALPNVQFTLQIDSPLTSNGGMIAVDPTDLDANNDVLVGVGWSRGNSNTNGRWSLRLNGISYNGTNASFAAGVTPFARVRGDGTRLYVEESVDGGNTWVDKNPTVIVAQPASILHIKTFFGESSEINNIRHTGLTLSNDI